MQLIDLKSGLRDRSSHLVELECFRGLAIWLVILFHLNGVGFRVGMAWAPAEVVSLPFAFIASGRTGVTLFFVLSGFLLSLPFLRSAGHEPVSARRFYVARVLRIVPAYYLAVLFAMLVTGKVEPGLRALAFQMIGNAIFPYSVVWWTLVVEAQFYLLLPLIMGLALHPKRRILLIAVGVLWTGAYLAAFVFDPTLLGDYRLAVDASVLAHFPAFGLGIGAALWYARGQPGADALRQRRWLTTATSLVLVYVLGLLLRFAAEVGGVRINLDYHYLEAFEALCWTLILLLVLTANPFGRRLLVNRFFAMSGKISFSLYLIHLPMIFVLTYPVTQSLTPDEATGDPAVYGMAAVAIVSSLLLSTLTFRLIELPFLHLKERLLVFVGTERRG